MGHGPGGGGSKRAPWASPQGTVRRGREGGFGMTHGCDVLVCSWRRLLADRHSLPFPWTLSLHRRWCPSASHHPLTFLFLLALTFPLPSPFLPLAFPSVGCGAHRPHHTPSLPFPLVGCANGAPGLALFHFSASSTRRGRQGGGGAGTQKLAYQKGPHRMFPMVNFVFPRNGHFGRGWGSRGGLPPLLLRWTAVLILPCRSPSSPGNNAAVDGPLRASGTPPPLPGPRAPEVIRAPQIDNIETAHQPTTMRYSKTIWATLSPCSPGKAVNQY